MFVKELRDFLERLFRFRSVKVVQELSVRLTLKDLKCRLNSSLAELAMDANGAAQQKITRTCGEDLPAENRAYPHIQARVMGP
jgi:hypothetical protein